jgi:phosphomannomutase
MSFNWKTLQNGSDIRGVALEGVTGETVNLTAERVEILGQVFVHWLSEKLNTKNLTIAVGTDSRLSGPDLKEALINGLCTAGANALDCGMASTPAMFMTTITAPFLADGAIMLTASHLPFNRNGMKFFTKQGGLEKANITSLLEQADQHVAIAANKKGKITEVDFIEEYAKILADKIKKEVSADDFDQPLKGFKIVVDAGNGAGGFYATKVLEPLGADVSASQFLNPDGRFPNHVPNPEDPKAMASICEAVKEHKAQLGIIFDTDVDRAAFVDHLGQSVNRNDLVALSSAIVLDEHPGSTIVTDSITSDGLNWFINDFLHGKHHRFQRGYKNVINEAIRLNETGTESWLAIETSGHAALKENHFLDDGAYLATKIVIKMAQLHKDSKSLTSLIKDLPVPMESKEFRLKITHPEFKEIGEKVISELGIYAASKNHWELVPNNYEGVRVACSGTDEKGWFLMRLSLHDPVIPVNIESDTEGGVANIASKLVDLLRENTYLDSSPLENL